MSTDIYNYIIEQENNYQTKTIQPVEGWDWNMYKHIKLSTLYKHGQLESGNDGNKPIKNIIKPILNVAYRSEGFDVKDITLFVDDEKNYYKSFLTKKYHSRWARLFDLDTFIDDLVESYIDYGGALNKYTGGDIPENVPLQRIAFCDQTNILGGVICEKYTYTIDELLDMTAWDQDKIKEAIDASVAEKSTTDAPGEVKATTPSKYIEVYALHGMMPKKWLSKKEGDEYDTEENGYVRQTQYVTFATKDRKENKNGICLWKGVDKKKRYKFIARDKIFNRALGYGGVEELFEPQVWTTYSMIRIKEMLDTAALMLMKTTDKALAERQKTSDLETGEIIYVADGKTLDKVDTQAINITQFDNAVVQWEQHARTTGSASESALAIRPSSGTPFSLEALNVQNGLEMHQWRQGKLATYMGELYRDWILPHIAKKMNEGDKWIDELSFEEMQWVAEQVANNEVTRRAIEAFRSGGKIITAQEGEQLRSIIKEDFKKSGSKKFFEIFKNEMKGMPLDVEVNIAGKQKDLARMTDKLTNIFRQVFANPAVLQIPGMAKIFNEILESAGLSPADFSGLTMMPVEAKAPVADEPVPTVQQKETAPMVA